MSNDRESVIRLPVDLFRYPAKYERAGRFNSARALARGCNNREIRGRKWRRKKFRKYSTTALRAKE